MKRHSFALKRLALLLLVFAFAVVAAAGCSGSSRDDAKSETAAHESKSDSETATEEGSGVTKNESSPKAEEPKPADGMDGSKDDSGTESTAEEPAKREEDRGGDEGEEKPQVDHGKKPQAGQLTAGEWNDLDHWDWWLKLMNRQKWSQYPHAWGFSTYEKLTVIAKSDNGPAVDAKVTVFDEQDDVVWTTRTNNRGEAVVFARLFSENETQEGETYTVKVVSGQNSGTAEDVQIPRSGPLTIELSSVQKKPDLLDVMFVVDTTGSMADELNYLEAELKNVVNRVKSHNDNELTVRLSSNFYRDEQDEYTVRSFPFTEDVDKVVNQIGRQEADGGGDYEEAVEKGLDDAINDHEWSDEARARLLFLVLDAPPHKTDNIAAKIRKLSAQAAKQGIRIIPVASSGVDKNTEFLMRTLAIVTGGTYVFLTDHSGIGGSHIEATVGDYDVQFLNDALVEIVDRYVK